MIAGADDFVAFTRKAIGRPAQATAHQVHAPEIELTSATRRGVLGITGRRPLRPRSDPVGYGHYHGTYENVDGQWLIKSSKLTRLREDIVTPLFSLYISDRLRKAGAKLAGRLSVT